MKERIILQLSSVKEQLWCCCIRRTRFTPLLTVQLHTERCLHDTALRLKVLSFKVTSEKDHQEVVSLLQSDHKVLIKLKQLNKTIFKQLLSDCCTVREEHQNGHVTITYYDIRIDTLFTGFLRLKFDSRQTELVITDVQDDSVTHEEVSDNQQESCCEEHLYDDVQQDVLSTHEEVSVNTCSEETLEHDDVTQEDQSDEEVTVEVHEEVQEDDKDEDTTLEVQEEESHDEVTVDECTEVQDEEFHDDTTVEEHEEVQDEEFHDDTTVEEHEEVQDDDQDEDTLEVREEESHEDTTVDECTEVQEEDKDEETTVEVHEEVQEEDRDEDITVDECTEVQEEDKDEEVTNDKLTEVQEEESDEDITQDKCTEVLLMRPRGTIFTFLSDVVDPPATLVMGADKYENDNLIAQATERVVFFHVDDMPSAHVYLLLEEGESLRDVPTALLHDAAQLCKANSTQGKRLNNVTVIYTPGDNLLKTRDMKPGEVGFHSSKGVKKLLVKRADDKLLARLNGTKTKVVSAKVQQEQEERARQRQLQKTKQKEQRRKLREQKKQLNATETADDAEQVQQVEWATEAEEALQAVRRHGRRRRRERRNDDDDDYSDQVATSGQQVSRRFPVLPEQRQLLQGCRAQLESRHDVRVDPPKKGATDAHGTVTGAPQDVEEALIELRSILYQSQPTTKGKGSQRTAKSKNKAKGRAG